MKFWIFLLHSVIPSLSLAIFLWLCLILLLIKANTAFLVILDSTKLLLLNFILQELGMIFSLRHKRLNTWAPLCLTNWCFNPSNFLSSFRVSPEKMY